LFFFFRSGPTQKKKKKHTQKKKKKKKKKLAPTMICLRALVRRQSGVRVLRAESTDPFLNIATEARLFEEGVPGTPADMPSLFLWRNAPVVILGKHQNPWKEIDIARAKRERPSVPCRPV
jgi:hypothetical protein